MHLLCYLHDPAHPGLLEEITKAKDARFTRAERMVSLLAEDYPLSWDDVIHHVAPGATLGRPHIADALVAAGRGRGPHRGVRIHPDLAFTLLRAALRAGPGVRRRTGPRGRRRAGVRPSRWRPPAGGSWGSATYREMIDAGLAGLEIYHRDNPEEGRAFLRKLADRHGLLVTGSSDYHGAGQAEPAGREPDLARGVGPDRGTGNRNPRGALTRRVPAR